MRFRRLLCLRTRAANEQQMTSGGVSVHMSSQVRPGPPESCERKLRICCEFEMWLSESLSNQIFRDDSISDWEGSAPCDGPTLRHIQRLAISAQSFRSQLSSVSTWRLGSWRAMEFI